MKINSLSDRGGYAFGSGAERRYSPLITMRSYQRECARGTEPQAGAPTSARPLSVRHTSRVEGQVPQLLSVAVTIESATPPPLLLAPRFCRRPDLKILTHGRLPSYLSATVCCISLPRLSGEFSFRHHVCIAVRSSVRDMYSYTCTQRTYVHARCPSTSRECLLCVNPSRTRR